MDNPLDEPPWDAPAVITTASGIADGLTLAEALTRYDKMSSAERGDAEIRLEHPHVSGALDEDAIVEMLSKLASRS